MPPLITHNVPEEECYVGENGIRRPYALIYPLYEDSVTMEEDLANEDSSEGAAKLKKNAPETGSFGKSSSRARSRSKTGTPAKREDPTILAGDALFANYIQSQARAPERKASTSNALPSKDGKTNLKEEHHIQNDPTEVILRGYKSTHQYAAIRTYESIAGRICEDYPRDPPVEERRFRTDIREPAATRPRRLTPEERAKAARFAGGKHWIKVTFESAEAAESAIASSPQSILGNLVFAEIYRGVPPKADEESSEVAPRRDADAAFGSPKKPGPGFASTTSRNRRGLNTCSPTNSQASSSTLDTATLSTATLSSTTVTGLPDDSPSIFNPLRKGHSISPSSQASSATVRGSSSTLPPGIKPATLLPAHEALLPRPSAFSRVLSQLPFGSWIPHDIIGSQVPRTETGDFDWKNASFYWKLIYLLDKWLNFQNGDVCGKDLEFDTLKED